MNALFFFAGGLDLQSNHSRLREFWRLDNEIKEMQDKMSYKELFHSLEYSLLLVRAKHITKHLNNN